MACREKSWNAVVAPQSMRATTFVAFSLLPVDTIQLKLPLLPRFKPVWHFFIMEKKLPSLVIVGRPNVGKSTLFNRLTGTRRSIVTNEPGITRDRIYGQAEWRGHSFEIVDTGGIIPDDKALIPTEIFRQARVAIDKAALLILVVDSQAGITPLDEELARLLRGTSKPFFVAVNKVDSPQQEANAATFHRLGAPVFPITAEHGTGVDDLLDAAIALVYPDSPAEKEGALLEGGTAPENGREIEIAIIGRPNVGKSTLLNRLVGEERSIVSPVPGTTMDTVDTELHRDGHLYRFVDTAGIRRKGKTNLVAEKLSVVMARRGLERADVALLVVDSEQGVTQGDAQIANYAEQSGRSVIIVMNKWDLALEAARKAAASRTATSRDSAVVAQHAVPAGKRQRFAEGRRPERSQRHAAHQTSRRKAAGRPDQEPYSDDFEKGQLLRDYEAMIRSKLKFLSYAPIVFLSAKTGERSDSLFPLIDEVAATRRRRIPTPELNRWLKEEVDLQRGSTPKSRPVRIYYITQAKAAPPTFLLFTNQKQPLHFSFERFLENRLRAKYDFMGTPVRFVQRLRKRGERHSREG
jgi:GTPase